MMQLYADLADSFLRGNWRRECDCPTSARTDELTVATLLDIAQSLHRIYSIISCPNLRDGLIATRRIEKLLKEKRKQAPAKRRMILSGRRAR